MSADKDIGCTCKNGENKTIYASAGLTSALRGINYSALFENPSIGIAVISGEGVVLDSNALFSYITGYHGKERDGLYLPSIFEDGDASRVEQVIGLCYKGCNPGTNLEVRLIKKDGSRIWGRIGLSPQWDGSGSGKFCYVFLDDISEEINERERSEVAVKKINFIGNLAKKDILNRLTAINCYLDLAGSNGNPEGRQYYAIVCSHLDYIRRFLKFISQIHDVGLYEPEWRLLSGIFDEIRKYNAQIPVEYDIRFKKIEVLSDQHLIPVFEKLFENSLEHGKFTTRIIISFSEDESGSVTITWKDNGIGIPLDSKERIFSGRSNSDAGFGLMLVREILSFSGATIRENGVPGEGAAFEIVFPPEYCRHLQ